MRYVNLNLTESGNEADCEYPLDLNQGSSPASIVESNKQWVGTCLYHEEKGYKIKKVMNSIKRIKILIGICMGLMMLCFGLGIVIPMESKVTAFEQRYTFVCPLTWNDAAAGIQAADEEGFSNTKFIGMEQIDAKKQAQAIREAVLTQPDGIITGAAEDSEEIRNAVNMAEAKGIPVILIDSDLEDSDRTCYIGTDNQKAGHLAGKDMYEATGGKAHIAVIVSTMSSPNQMERVNGFKEEISQYPDMSIEVIEECHSQKLEIKEKLPELFKEHPDINALFLVEGIASATVGKVIKDMNMDTGDLKIISFDRTQESSEYIKEKIYYSLIVQEPYQQGYLAVKTLNDLYEGKEVEEKIYTESKSIKYSDIEENGTQRYEGIEWHMY